MWRLFGSTKPIGPMDGPPALVIPGFVAHDRDDARAAPRARRGRLAGARLGDGVNWGARADTIERLKQRLDEIPSDGKVLLVGWSLGGLFARELARAFPERVRAVVTLGSPFSGDPQAEQCWRLYEWIARSQGRRAADPASDRQAAGAAAGLLVAQGRADRAALGARARA